MVDENESNGVLKRQAIPVVRCVRQIENEGEAKQTKNRKT